MKYIGIFYFLVFGPADLCVLEGSSVMGQVTGHAMTTFFSPFLFCLLTHTSDVSAGAQPHLFRVFR